MTGQDDTSGECRLGWHDRCHGNIDLKSGAGPAVPLMRCACSCHGKRVRVKQA